MAGQLLYVANQSGNTVKVIDTSTNLVVQTISTPSAAGAVAIDIPRNLLYISRFSATGLDIYDINAATFSGPFSTIAGWSLVISPDGTQLFVGGFDTRFVQQFSLPAHVIGSSSTVSGYAGAFSLDSTKFYIAENPKFYEINASTMALISTLVIGGLTVSTQVAVTADGTKLFGTDQNTQNVYVVNIPALTLNTTIAMPDRTSNIVLSPDGTKMWAYSNGAITGTPKLYPITVATNVVGTGITVNTGGNNRTPIIILPDNRSCYVDSSTYVQPVDLITGVNGTTIPMTTGDTFGMCLGPVPVSEMIVMIV